MRNRKLAIGLSSMAVLLIFAMIAYLYTEFEGYPWKRAAIKRDAVQYLKEKYDMDAIAVESFFNFKFDTYIAHMKDRRDPQGEIIYVESERRYDEISKQWSSVLTDNYREVYWVRKLNEELKSKYSEFYHQEDILKATYSFAYSLADRNEGVSEERDEDGVSIPLMPDNSYSLDIKLRTGVLTDAFTEQLYKLASSLKEENRNCDLFISVPKPEGSDTKYASNEEYYHFEIADLSDRMSLEQFRSALMSSNKS